MFKPLQGFIAIAVCVCVCPSVSLSVNNLAQKVFNQSTFFLVETFPLTRV